MSFNGIAFMIASFVHATALARGVDNLQMSAMSTVPAEDMRAALAYGELLHEQVSEIYRNSSAIRWPATSRTLVADVLGGAMDATRHLARSARESLALAHAGEVPALRGGLITHGVQRMFLAQELLEVASGERPLAESSLEGMDQAIADQVLKLTPLIGECVMAFEAASGRRVVDLTQRLTPAERAMSGLAILLPHALGYVAGRVGNTVSKAALVTRRAIRLAVESAKVFRILDGEISVRLFTQMAVSLRTVSEAEFKEFVELLLLELRNATLTYAQKTRLAYFMFRMSARTRQALWLNIVEKELGKNLSGVQLLKNTRPSAGELETFRKFSAVAKKPVVLLPEVAPAQYPAGKQVNGARYPDGVLEGELFDLLSTSKNSTISDILRSFEKKDSQATKILNALMESKVGVEEVSKRINEVWANPKILNIDTIILFDGVTVITHTRPNAYVPPFAVEAMRLLAGQTARMVSVVQQVESEPL